MNENDLRRNKRRDEPKKPNNSNRLTVGELIELLEEMPPNFVVLRKDNSGFYEEITKAGINYDTQVGDDFNGGMFSAVVL